MYVIILINHVPIHLTSLSSSHPSFTIVRSIGGNIFTNNSKSDHIFPLPGQCQSPSVSLTCYLCVSVVVLSIPCPVIPRLYVYHVNSICSNSTP